jgi:hypothetical protein
MALIMASSNLRFSIPGRLLKNYHQMVIQSILKNQKYLKSPFVKGGFRRISGSYNPP